MSRGRLLLVVSLALAAAWLLWPGAPAAPHDPPASAADDAPATSAGLRGLDSPEQVRAVPEPPAATEPRPGTPRPSRRIEVRVRSRRGEPLGPGEIERLLVERVLPGDPEGEGDAHPQLREGRNLSDSLLSADALAARVVVRMGGRWMRLPWDVPAQCHVLDLERGFEGRVGVRLAGRWLADAPIGKEDHIELVVDLDRILAERARLTLRFAEAATQRPVADVWIELRHLASGAVVRHRQRSSDVGDPPRPLVLGALRPGVYEIVARAAYATEVQARPEPGREPLAETAYMARTVGALRTELRAGQDHELVVPLASTGRVRLRVIDVDGSPKTVSRTMLPWISADQIPLYVGTSRHGLADGIRSLVMLDDVPAGRGCLQFGGASYPIEVHPGRVVDAEIQLRERRPIVVEWHGVGDEDAPHAVTLIDPNRVPFRTSVYSGDLVLSAAEGQHHFELVPAPFDVRVRFLDGRERIFRRPRQEERLDEDGDPYTRIRLPPESPR